MNDPQSQQQKQQQESLGDPLMTGPLDADAYPATIEKMSDKWREVQQQQGRQEQTPRNFVERNSLALGIGLALLIVALLIVIGGFAFLILNAR